MSEALTSNEDGAKRHADIHWPDGFHDLWLKALKDLSEQGATVKIGFIGAPYWSGVRVTTKFAMSLH